MMISSIMQNDYYDLFNDDEDQSHHDLNGQLIWLIWRRVDGDDEEEEEGRLC